MTNRSLELRLDRAFSWLKNALAWVMVKVLLGRMPTRVLEPLTRHRVRHLGLTIETEHPAFSPRARAQIFWGMYEREEVRFIHIYLAGASNVVELGAGLGVTGAHLLASMQSGGRLLCVEANPLSVPALTANLPSRAREAGIDLEIQQTAIYEGDHRIPIAYEGDLLTARLDSGRWHGTAHDASTVTLADLVRRHSFDRFALVSDIEGAEATFILGDDDGLARCERLIIELHETDWGGRHVTEDELLAALIGTHGFRVLANRGRVYALTRVGGIQSPSTRS